MADNDKDDVVMPVPAAEDVAMPAAEDETTPELAAEEVTLSVPAAEDVAMPAAEDVAMPAAEDAVMPTAEDVAMPAAEDVPTPEPAAEDVSTPDPSAENAEEEAVVELSVDDPMLTDGEEEGTVEDLNKPDLSPSKKPKLSLPNAAAVVGGEGDGEIGDIVFSGVVGNACGPGPGGPTGDYIDGNEPCPDVTLDDVGGLVEQKKWLRDAIIRPLKHPETNQFGIPLPVGILFYGPPGTGKTLLARAFGIDLSRELGKPVEFHYRKGGDLMDPFCGESERKVRELFHEAKCDAPSIIFLDELDGVCPDRNGINIGHAHISLVTALLGELDNVKRGEVFVFGATNRIASIDPAMRRPGRLDKHLEFFPPNLQGRMDIININTKAWKRSRPEGEFLQFLGNSTIGLTGADLNMLCREVFYNAFRRHNPDNDMDKSIADLEILQEDWEASLRNMRPSKTAVFGSGLYIPKPAKPNMRTLAARCVNKVKAAIQNHMKIAEQHTRWDGPNGQDIPRIETVLLTCEKIHSDASLEDCVIPSALSDPELNKYPVYRIKKSDLLCIRPIMRSIFVSQIVGQAASSQQPCILLLQGIDAIVGDCANVASALHHNISQLKERPVIVLATSSSGRLPEDADFKKIFENGTLISPPKTTAEERKRYFSPLFVEGMKVNGAAFRHPKAMENKMTQCLKQVIKNSEKASFEALHNLFGLLDRIVKISRNLVDKEMMLTNMANASSPPLV